LVWLVEYVRDHSHPREQKDEGVTDEKKANIYCAKTLPLYWVVSVYDFC
jgi:hypothetical protein